MLAFLIAAAQNFLMSVRCSPATLPGKRYWLPELSWRMLATRLAAGALSGRCSVRLCLVWWEGLIQTPRFRSKSAFRALSTSPIRAPVSSCSRTAFAARWFGCSSSTRTRRCNSSSCSQRWRFCSSYRRMPLTGLEDDVVEHRSVVAHALWPLLGAGILLEVVRREVPHGRRLPLGPTLGDGVLPAGSVAEEASGLPFRLVEGQQRSVLPDRHALRLASVAGSVLDDVTADACRLDPEAEAGEGAVPHHELLERASCTPQQSS